MADTFVDAREVVPNAETLALPEGYVAVDAVVLVKCFSPDADKPVWCTRYTKDLTSVETLGALRAATLLEERHLLSLYSCDHEDDEDND